MALTKVVTGGIADNAVTTAKVNPSQTDITALGTLTGVLTANGGAVFNEASADVDFRVESDNDVNAFFVQGSDGKVGIGTSSPAQLLSLSSASNPSISIKDTTNNVEGLIYSDDSVVHMGSLSNHPLVFRTNNAERMRIDTSGKVYIGTTSNANSGAMIVQQASNGTGITVNGVNNTSGAVFMYFTEAGANCGYIQRVGTTSAVVYSTSSDYRLKENVTPMTGALAKVSLLKPITFDWKDGGSSQGFIAHELQEVIPDAVTGVKDQVNEDGSIKSQGIDTSYVVATLTSAIQEQQATIETLIARITALEGV